MKPDQQIIQLTNNEGNIFYAHCSAFIDDSGTIGENTRIWHFSHVMQGAVIGKACVLGQNVYVAGTVRIGSNVKIQNNVSLYDGVILEDDVFCGPSMVFTNVINPRSFINRKDEYRTTIIKKGASIGANATILCGVTIGQYAFIGAGAVVTRDVPAQALMTGVPARQRGWVCTCGDTLGADLKCIKCNRQYMTKDDILIECKK